MTLLSIIVPCYNEEQRLGSTLDEIALFVSRRTEPVEVIVVDDGSRDGTAAVAERHVCPGLRVIRTEENQGKGHAVRTGMLAALGDLRLFTDADGSTSMTEYAKLEAALTGMSNPGVALASIGVGAAEVQRAQRGLRPLAGRVGNWLIRVLAVPGISDTQRGFKLFTAEAAEDIFSRCVIDRWAFDVEVLALASHLGYDMAEVAVTWAHKDDSRVTAFSYLSSLADVVRVRWRLLRHRYDREPIGGRRG